MKEIIRERAWELGFDTCRFTSADPPDNAASFQAWLAAGRHGEMGYLVRNAYKRIDPQQVLPVARTIICLAASYWMADGVSPGRPEWPKTSPLGATPSAATTPASRTSGVVARYARATDYHDVLGERLKI